MNNISAVKITLSFPTITLFEEISLSIRNNDRIAIIGENGAGKTSLMKILSGIQKPTKGSVQIDEWSTSLYIQQEPSFSHEKKSINDFFKDVEEYDTFLKIIEKLGMDHTVTRILQKPIHSLSYGQQRIFEIARGIASNKDYLFIDEPENHLDIFARNGLIALLKQYTGAVVFVSHDRSFINDVASTIVGIENQKVRKVRGTYEDYIKQRQHEVEAQIRRWTAEKRDIAQLENAVRILQMRAKFNCKGTGSSSGSGAYRSRKRELQERKNALGRKPLLETDAIRLPSIEIGKKNSKVVLDCKNVSFRYEKANSDLLSNVELHLQFGERVALIGRNGTGKSTLINLIKGNLASNHGTIIINKKMVTHFFDQSSQIDDKMTPLKIALTHCRGNEEEARHLLARLLFERDEVNMSIQHFSNGQINRLRIALLFLNNPDFIVLDEPTNNLDPMSWDVLTDQIQNYAGTLLVASHDILFLEYLNLDKFWIAKDGSIFESHHNLPGILKEL